MSETRGPAPRPPFQTREVLGIPVADLDAAALARHVLEAAAAGRGGQIFALNVHTYTEACRQRAYGAVLRDSYLVYADGVPISWVSRLGGPPVPRTHGHDFMMETLRQSQGTGIRHFFLGGTEQTLSAMVERLHADLPRLDIAGTYSPPFRRLSEEEERATAERINATGAGVLWVALGAPRQERWIHRMNPLLKVPVQAGVGAAFEIIAGRFSRAPRWLQRCGLEWSWRLAQDPARLWRRYFSTNGFFLTQVLRRLGGAVAPPDAGQPR
jgi:N-acetylglucosaminyldiphosphoundecaprenol N-acetyl-beta-D-mannosaminyltransferase